MKTTKTQIQNLIKAEKWAGILNQLLAWSIVTLLGAGIYLIVQNFFANHLTY